MATAEQVLVQFQERFFREVDTDGIVSELIHRSIIDGGVVEAITQKDAQLLKNEMLYLSLRAKCTREALRAVCDVIIAVESNPVMKALGEDMKSMLEGGEIVSPPPAPEEGSAKLLGVTVDPPQSETVSGDDVKDSILSQNVNDRPGHLKLLRKHVSRRVAGKGKALLEGLELDTATIRSCFWSNPLDEEGAVQAGLAKWIDGRGRQPPTWGVLIEAMSDAEIAQQHIQSLKTDLGFTEERKEDEARKWQSAYKDSLKKHGSVSVEVTRSILVGPPEVGKSSLKHLLVHNTPKAIKESTGVMDTPEVVSFSSEQYAVEDGISAWQLINSDIMRKSLHACIANKAYAENDQYPLEDDAGETEGGELGATVERQKHALHVTKRLKAKQDASDPIALLDEQHSRLIQEMGGEGKVIELRNASFIHLLDTGGQPSFQDVLPLLLDVPCTYIQVFNAARDLDQPVPITYRPDDHTNTEVDPQLSTETGWEMMLRSFSSMQTMAHKCSKELASFQQEGGQLPQLRIYVVGTYKDQLIEEGRLDKATQDIGERLRELEGKPYYNTIQWDSAGQPFFLVHTMAGKDEGTYVNGLREGLSSMGSSLKLDVPVVWFICQEITSCIPKKFFRLQDLEAFCVKHEFVDGDNADSQFRALLQLFSLLGFYSFFNLEGVPDEDNFICTDTGVFLKEVSKLLAVQFLDPKSSEMATFKKTGILVFTTKLFQELGMCQEMDPYWFLEALQHLGIAAHLPSKGQQYFIPAVLPPSLAVTQDLPASVAPICLTYKTEESVLVSYSYLPRGVFCRLAVELIRRKWKITAKDITRTLLTFRWREFEILLQESPGYISLIPRVVEQISTISELHSGCVDLLHTTKDCLLRSAEAVVGSHFSTVAELAVGFECPCTDVSLPHLAVPSDTGKSLECLETSSHQTCTKNQHIWFSAPVDGVEIKHCPEKDIWALEDSDEGTASPPLPTLLQPQPIPDQAEQVLDYFQDRFIKYMDASAILYGLKDKEIISDGDEATIGMKSSATLQNQFLHGCLKAKCTSEAFMTVCDLIVAVQGNPQMNSLGEEMKTMLESLLGATPPT